MVALRYAYVLALVVWLGGMLVLGALVAPTTFQILQAIEPTTGRELAGEVFGVVVGRFHAVAYAAGGLMLATLTAMAVLGPRPRAFAARSGLLVLMLAIAVYSGRVVIARIDRIQRAVGGPVSRLEADDARRLQFDALHRLSERLMLVNVLGALALLYWEARE
jgi:uncharacterized membrane protein